MRKSVSCYFFKRKPVIQKDRYALWRGVVNLSGFKADERLRVEWMVFYQIVEYEWLYNFNLSLDPEELNPGLTEWVIEYDFNRAHQSLG